MRSVILMAGLLQLAAISYAQKASIAVKNASFNEVVNILKKQTGVDFLYNNSYTKDIKPLTLNMQHAELSAIMNKCLENEPLVWTYKNKTILITPRPAPVKTSTANEVTLTGTVTDEKGEGMAGVTITVRNLDKITATNEKGAYTLQLPTGNEVLIFRFVGYKTQEISVDTRRTLNVSMELDASNLNAVTVVGYGTQKKISLVGAQSTVSAKDLQQPTRSLANSLAGRIAGVIAVQRTGEPGNDDASIWIRGISTFDNSLSKPLVLIDGAPRSFVNIDPEDIESFTVLKDASATAVYGVRGANGVIIITTKKGATGKPKIRFRYNEGITSFTKLPAFVDGITYMEMSNEALVNRGSAPKYTEAQIDATRNQTDMELYPNVDWMHLLFKKNGSMRKANLNISGGSEATQYYVSAAYYSEK
ncbi:MAG TPA: SusC/RagA family TonB-linked outer membrane protein, partial [Niastella sp.]|nr:SusC/RagA family TonB-linked outer membrane protein [Niastella sp.]